MSDNKIERREFVKRAAYAAPVILTLTAMPAFAASGSKKSNEKLRDRGDPSGKTPPSSSESHSNSNRDSSSGFGASSQSGPTKRR